jgi:hypothetical protein
MPPTWEQLADELNELETGFLEADALARNEPCSIAEITLALNARLETARRHLRNAKTIIATHHRGESDDG